MSSEGVEYTRSHWTGYEFKYVTTKSGGGVRQFPPGDLHDRLDAFSCYLGTLTHFSEQSRRDTQGLYELKQDLESTLSNINNEVYAIKCDAEHDCFFGPQQKRLEAAETILRYLAEQPEKLIESNLREILLAKYEGGASAEELEECWDSAHEARAASFKANGKRQRDSEYEALSESASESEELDSEDEGLSESVSEVGGAPTGA